MGFQVLFSCLFLVSFLFREKTCRLLIGSEVGTYSFSSKLLTPAGIGQLTPLTFRPVFSGQPGIELDYLLLSQTNSKNLILISKQKVWAGISFAPCSQWLVYRLLRSSLHYQAFPLNQAEDFLIFLQGTLRRRKDDTKMVSCKVTDRKQVCPQRRVY